MDVAALSVARSVHDVVQFEKLGEGGSNRAFLLTMRDGFKHVARVPYPVTVPKNLAVASEAATMAFLHRHGIPTPRLYGYSATSENAAGTEYILMEYIEATNLGDVWSTMNEKNRLALVTSIVELESRLFNIPFPAFGSLYYSGDLPDGTARVPIDPGDVSPRSFCVGPDTRIPFWFGKRSDMAISRGTFTTADQVLAAGAKKELVYLETCGRALHPYFRIRRGTVGYRKQDPSVYVDTLKKYLQVASDLIPKTVQSPVEATIRHPDLQPNNIFVAKDFTITNLIDWQQSAILPLYLQSGIPHSLGYFEDPAPQSTPRLPDDVDQMDPDEQTRQHELLQKRQLHSFYTSETAGRNITHFEILKHDRKSERRRLYDMSLEPWDGDNVTLRSSLVQLAQKWMQATTALHTCPIQFSPEESQECIRLEAENREADVSMAQTQERFAVGPGSRANV